MLAIVLVLGVSIGGKYAGASYIKWSYIRAAVLLLVGLVLGIGRSVAQTEFCNTYSSVITGATGQSDEAAGTARIQGKIYKKEIRNGEPVLYLDHVYLQTGGHIYATCPVMVYQSDQLYPIGKTIIADGSIRQLRTAVNEGNYDELSYYHSMGMDYHFNLNEVIAVKGKTDVVRENLFLIKEKLKEEYINIFQTDNIGIMSAMLLGDKELLESEQKGIYQQAGIAHILVISGMHISFIGMSIYRLIRRKGSYLLSGIISEVLLTLYVEMIGNGISARRAVIMFFLLITGKVIGRSYDSLTGLSLALLVLLMENPRCLFNGGLQFSVAAIIGITVVAPVLIKRFGKGRIQEMILVPAVIQLMTFPLMAAYYYEVPVYGVFLNIIVVPMLSYVLINGIVVTLFAVMHMWCANVLAYPLEALLGMIDFLTKRSVELPGAHHITGAWSFGRVVLYYFVFMISVLLLCHVDVAGQEGMCSKRKGAKLVFRCCMPRICVGVLLVLVILCPVRNRKMYAFLDVGQGDGIYIRAENGTNLFIDGGSSNVSGVGTYRILSFLKYNGISKMDYWFVTHYDEDHVNGLIQILEEQEDYDIGQLMLPRKLPDNDNYKKLVMLAKEREIPIAYIRQGERLLLGEAVLDCIFPDADYEGADENGMSSVLLYREGEHTAVFTGDIGTAEEERMVEELDFKKLLKADRLELLKAAHHGSNYSNSSKWLKLLTPEYTVISCGIRNRYHHPGTEALARMEEAGTQILYTMYSGQISVLRKGEGIVIENYISSLEAVTGNVLE